MSYNTKNLKGPFQVMSMGRLAEVFIALTVLFLYTGLLTEGAMGTNVIEHVPIESLELMGLSQEVDQKICRPCHCCHDGTCNQTKCCYMTKCNQPGNPPFTCTLTKLSCGSCDPDCA
uniref:Uncharacterized protein n=1 Tax=Hordeum vulgare subsp. vulgare TaxID=112509 RepID=A0A8I7B994_HORVV